MPSNNRPVIVAVAHFLHQAVGFHEVFLGLAGKAHDDIGGQRDIRNDAWEANQGELDTIVPVLIEGVSKRDELVLAGKSPKNQTVHAPVPAGRESPR